MPPPTTMLLHRLPSPAQARPRLSRAAPVARPRQVPRAAPANGGSSSVADRQEQAASASERPPSPPASSPPPPSPSPPSPPPPAEPDQQRRQQQPEASTSSSPPSPSSSSSQQQNPSSSNKALEAERPWRRRLRRAFSALPLSIFTPYENLPADGRTQTLAEEACDPMERNCQIPMHVWESPCGACAGTGSTRNASAVRAARGRGRARSSFSTTFSTCLACSGVGYVRYTTARLGPPRGLNGRRRRGGAGDGSSEGPLGPLTLARPAADEDDGNYIWSDSESDDDDEEGGGSYSASYSDDEEEGEGS